MKQLINTLGGTRFDCELEEKATDVFVSTGSIPGGHETTIPTRLVLHIHLGMVFVGVRSHNNPQIMTARGGAAPRTGRRQCLVRTTLSQTP